MTHGLRMILVLALLSLPAMGNDGMSEGPYKAYLPGVDGVTQPKRQKYVAPAYPKAHKASQVETRVILLIIVQANGSVSQDVDSLKCEFRTGSEAKYTVASKNECAQFDAAAREAVRQWRYEPATKDGKPVDAYQTVAVTLAPS